VADLTVGHHNRLLFYGEGPNWPKHGASVF
jgi:hypothetical protein